MSYTPHFPPTLHACIQLPASKSLSNRALLLCALSGPQSRADHLAVCEDTAAMQAALSDNAETLDIGAAGTAMRFLTAYWAASPGTLHQLTGTERMKQRPIGILAEALRQLGADIEYLGQPGYPPLRIRGTQLCGKPLQLPADVSSQYISALLMTGPLVTGGLTLRLQGDIISRPYIDMTLHLMQHFGASAEWLDQRTLYVSEGRYQDGTHFTVESDWSAASYWYETVALSPDANAEILLPGLFPNSLQGDSAVSQYFEPLGVTTTYDPNLPGMRLSRTPDRHPSFPTTYVLDLQSTPDLAQTLVVTCALLHRPFRFSGLRSLRIKETDRIRALQNELLKLGISLQCEGDDVLTITQYPGHPTAPQAISIATYNDHRMAMAFAPAAQLYPSLSIENPEVVRKSYPDFWQHLQSL